MNTVFLIVDAGDAEEDFPVGADADLLAEIRAAVIVEIVVVHAVREMDDELVGEMLLRGFQLVFADAHDAVRKLQRVDPSSEQAVHDVAVGDRPFQRFHHLLDLRWRHVEISAVERHDVRDVQPSGGGAGFRGHAPHGMAVKDVELAFPQRLLKSGDNRVSAFLVQDADFLLREREIRIPVIETVYLDFVFDLVLCGGKSTGGENLGRIALLLKCARGVPDNAFRAAPFRKGEAPDDMSRPHSKTL